jgi:hypothetical protein
MEQVPPSSDIPRQSRAAYPPNFDKLCQLFGLYRDRMMHEDNLLNHRSTWHLVIQGFLFGTLGVLLKPGKCSDPPNAMCVLYQRLPFVVGGVGVLVSIFAWLSLHAAHIAIERLDREWREKKMRYDPGCLLPGLAGAGSTSARILGKLHGLLIPLTTGTAWALILFFLSHNAAQYGHTNLMRDVVLLVAPVGLTALWLVPKKATAERVRQAIRKVQLRITSRFWIALSISYGISLVIFLLAHLIPKK